MELEVRSSDSPTIKANSGSPPSSPPPGVIKQVVCTRGMPRSPSPNPNYRSQQGGLTRTYSSPTLTPSGSFHSAKSSSSTPTRGVTPLPTPTISHPVRPTISGNTRHSRGRSSSVRSPLNQELNTLFGSPAPSLSPVFRQHASPTTDHSPGHTVAPPTPGAHKPVSSHSQLSQTYESRRGSHVVLEFADPTSGTRTGSSAMAASMRATTRPEAQRAHSQSQTGNKPPAVTNFSRARTASEPTRQTPPVPPTPGGGQTRLQIAFEAVRKMGAGLASPRLDYVPRKSSQPPSAGAETKDPGYFDIVTEEGVET
ncbi:hypothetical protein J1614_008410 [Plenodomus biglobosus]|nr:hypothetical protein J1614_008410 [Plenodomus biglobosus]